MRWRRKRRESRDKPSIVLISGGTYALLVAISMAIVLGLSVRANYQNTFALLNDKAVLQTRALEDALRGFLDPMTAGLGSMQALYAETAMDLDEDETMRAALVSALYSVPAAERITVRTPEGREFGMAKTARGSPENFRASPGMRPAPLAVMPSPQDGPVWAATKRGDDGIFANVTVALARRGKVDGYLIASASSRFLDKIVADFDSGGDVTVFVLGRDGDVLAYSDRLSGGGEGAGKAGQPVALFGDPVLVEILKTPTMPPFAKARDAGVDVSEVDSAGGEYIAMTKKVAGYGPGAWTVGLYYRSGSVGREVERLIGSGLVGLLALLVAVFLSFRVARRLTRPLSNIERQSRKVAALDFDSVEALPESPIREVDQLVQAFNSMVSGLKAVNTYFPKTLFQKLMKLGLEEATRSREVELTILFTDIVGFTRQSQGMSASETAELLNRHFALLVEAVEAQSGTVDKFLGDGMLAYWGAPDPQAEHAEAAVRAAGAMMAAQREANRTAETDAHRLRMRIGIHTGRVIVGNIGAFDRVDYTIVGDAVNVTQRLQDLGRNLAPDDEIVILTTDETLCHLAPAVPRRHFGAHPLRGRAGQVNVWMLYPDGTGADDIQSRL